jgi:hypothetical protein
MPSYKTVFGSFLKAEDLQGRQVRAVVESVQLEEIKSDQHGNEKKLVARFAGKEKGLVLNRTNADSLAEIAGDDDFENWPGTSLILFPDKTTFGGKKVDCIRIKAVAGAAPKAPEPEPEPMTADEVPF